MKHLAIVALLVLSTTIFGQPKDFARWVNPFIGTGGHGHTFPGATMPFGMVQLSPDTRIDNWDGSSGYHYSDDTIYGFSHTHLSGTGIPDGCDILFMPTVGEPQVFAKEGDKSVNGYASKFSHANEKAEPGYYSVKLDDDGILAEMTATKRVGFHRYTFPRTEKAHLTLDLAWRDKRLESNVSYKVSVDPKATTRIEGFRRSSSWAKNQSIFFSAEISHYVFGSEHKSEHVNTEAGVQSKQVAYRLNTQQNPIVMVKVAISHVSIQGARKNLEAELPGWDFEKVRADAKAAWNKELSKIEVSGGTPEQTTNFYTALYHTMVQPNIFNDVDGRYKGHDGKVHQLPGYSSKASISAAQPPYLRRSSASPSAAPVSRGYAAAFVGGEERRHSREDLSATGRRSIASPQIDGRSPEEGDQRSKIKGRRSNTPSEHFTVFSLWDTFRAAHPLYTIIDEKRTVDFINTFIRQYEQGGRLPVWELWGEETDTMIGYHAVSVIADAMAKGIKGFDYEKAYAASKHSAELDPFGLAGYKKRGYISMEDENESVSRTLEYAYNDWCIAQMAKVMAALQKPAPAPGRLTRLGDSREDERVAKYLAEAQRFAARSRYFENLFDTKTGFFRAKKNGGFVEPFSPTEVNFGFTEGNSWQYSFFVPHDVTKLMELMGGRQKFIAKLDELFSTSDKLSGREQADLTGLIGQYAHGNEPSHHIAYLYNYAGEPWKTQKTVRKIMDEFYKNAPDGLIGNEDCGQMSAWYILSASGFYPVAPGDGIYALGSPLFPEIKYRLESGKTFTVRAKNLSPKNIYVSEARLNGASHKKAFITHADITRGGVLEFSMTDQPSPTAFTEFPVSSVAADTVAAPLITANRTFSGQSGVTLSTLTPNAKIHYTTDGSVPSKDAKVYTAPFTIDRTTTVKAIASTANGAASFPVEAVLTKRPNDWTAKVISGYSTQYTGGGESGIIDGIRGTTNFASGEWQGIQGKPYEAVIDLKKDTVISEVGASFLQVAGPWIWMPSEIKFETSMDGVSYSTVANKETRYPLDDMKPSKAEYLIGLATPVLARYVRLTAKNIGKIPSWHLGAGGDPWIFIDEVIIRERRSL